MRISADGGKRTGKPGGNDDDRVEARVLRAVEEILRAIPSELNVDAIRDAKSSNLSPLNINLIQETQRYNQLLRSVHEWLRQLDRGIRGLVVMSRDLGRTIRRRRREPSTTALFVARILRSSRCPRGRPTW